MKIKQLIEQLSIVKLHYRQASILEEMVTEVTNDSRRSQEGTLFVAIKGYSVDGHDYIPKALAAGTVVVVFDETNQNRIEEWLTERMIGIQVPDSRQALARCAAIIYGRPTEQLKLVGITGTNGKTSTSYLVQGLLQQAERKNAVIGTIGTVIDGKTKANNRTTPEAHELQRDFRLMVDEAVDTAVMEVSSHALALHRVDDCRFEIAVFTNLTLDHLDFHQTMANYLAAKNKLFRMADKAVVNQDDSAYLKIMEGHHCQTFLTYSLKDETADLFADRIEHRLNGSSYDLHYRNQTVRIELQTPGDFSVANSLAAIGVGVLLNIPLPTIKQGLQRYSRVKGRFQTITSDKGYTAIVDYAHAPDGLDNVLRAIRNICQKRIITVFGCGGDRDKSKRSIMGEIAGRLSDEVIMTSDNPRTEEPDSIINQIEEGLKPTGCPYRRITDRRQAIMAGLKLAEAGDVVLVAGKGHEDYQTIGKKNYPFDDVVIVEEYIKKES